MTDMLTVTLIELKKARRSPVFPLTALAFLFISLVSALFMLILKYPERAKGLGIIGAKAQLAAISLSWESFLGLLLQATVVGGMVIFSFIASWVFGREYIDKTLKDLLAVPTARSTIVISKFVLITFWAFIFSTASVLIGILLGRIIGLPGFSYHMLFGYIGRIVIGGILAIVLSWVTGFIANVGRSYFPALGFVALAVALGQISSALGWGEYFPWAIVGIYAYPAGPVKLGAVSYAIVVASGLLSIWGTAMWWKYADHTS